VKLKTLLKNAISLLLTLIVVSSILDFIRKPNIPPEINATALYDLQGNAFFLPQLDQAKPTIIYFWGSWCGYCQQEHPLLMEISKDVPIVGIDYRDKPQNGIAMLERMGNPFILTIDDSRGEFAMQLGVDGAPETYIVDEHGMIRYRHSGYMDRETWLTEIKPKLDELTKK